MVWSAPPRFGPALLFQPVQYKNADHILMWQGEVNPLGHGFGYFMLLDQSYEVVKNVTSKLEGDVLADFHDAIITDTGAMAMTIYATEPWNLTQFEGPANGFISAGVVQEVDIETGNVLFTWNSLDHIDPSESYVSPGSSGGSFDSPWDYFHINSIDKDARGNYLISPRHCNALYYVDGRSGEILWKLGGKNSSFEMGEGTDFAYQHDARWAGENRISLFDNAGTDWTSTADTARGMLLEVDTAAMKVTLIREFLPYARQTSPSQGNMQMLDDGNVLIGWGSKPYFSEYDSNGNMMYSVHFGVGDVQAYRTIRGPWVGRPNTKPDIGFSKTDVFASWNGATEVATWELFGSTSAYPEGRVSLNKTAKTDFETAIGYTGSTSYEFYQVAALDRNGEYLGYSEFTPREDGPITTPVGHHQLQSLNPGFASAGRQGCMSASEDGDGAAVVIHDCNTEEVAKHDWELSLFGREDAGPQQLRVFGSKARRISICFLFVRAGC
ncbi:hypothetical protein AAF712_014557 [Marasmius tenuissimus]|uniref:Arylsulfotransferase n=1 Tax=Marasmius tenuissimus TaxID=585030 RepID=A0ABR2ZCP1_9AGAR